MTSYYIFINTATTLNICILFCAMLKKLLKKTFKRFIIRKNKNNSNPVRKDEIKIPVQPNLELIVYWKDLNVGKGPAAILKAHGKEIMKFDCFGFNKGHYHVTPHYGFRIYFTEHTSSEQIKRSGNELRRNAEKYLKLHEDKKVRSVKINQSIFNEKISEVEKKMTYLLHNVPQLKDLK